MQSNAEYKYRFHKEHPNDKIWWVEKFIVNNGVMETEVGELLVSFDGKTILNLFEDYPEKFAPEQKALFDKENPYWADFFKGK